MEEGSMIYKKRMLLLLILILVLGVTNMTACGFLDSASWKEEVLLHDGSKIIVERWQKHGGRHEPGQEPGIKEHTITFTLSGTKKVITWKDDYSKEIGHSNFDLAAMHILNGIPYLITTADGCLAYNKWGRPNPPYVIFKYEGNAWKRIGLPELPMEFKNINLVINPMAHEEKLVSLGLATAEMIEKFNNSLIYNHEQYKTIIRRPLKPGSLGVSCPDWSSTRYTSPKAPIPIFTESDKDTRK
jgi:hypothetical protein